MAARYWRLVALDTYGRGDLAITALQLWDASARLDDAAALSATFAPSAGDLADLQAGVLGDPVEWPAAAYRAPSFALVWDFGAGVGADVRCIRIGALDLDRFPYRATLQSSDDGVAWATYASASGIEWPGDGVLSPIPSGGEPPMDSNDALFMRFEGANGSTAIVDDKGHPFTANTGAQLTTTDPIDGTSSLNFSTGNSWASTPPSHDFDLGAGAFTIRFKFRPAVVGGASFIGRTHAGIYGIWREWDMQMRNANALNFYHGVRGYSSCVHVFNLPITLEVGQTYSVLMGRDAEGRFRLFINGLLATNTREGDATAVDFTDLSNPGNDLPLLLGTFYYYGNHYQGVMDSVRLRKGEGPPVDESGYRVIADETGFRALTTGGGASIAVASPVAAHSMPAPLDVVMARDIEVGGAGRIWGTTKTKATPSNLPTRARVVLHQQRSRLPVRETWSDPVTGAFSFDGIDVRQQFFVLAEDAAGAFRPVAAHRLVPEVS